MAQQQHSLRTYSKWPEVDITIIGGANIARNEYGREIKLCPPEPGESIQDWVECLSDEQIEACRIIYYERWCLDTGATSDKEIWDCCEEEKKFRTEGSYITNLGPPGPT